MALPFKVIELINTPATWLPDTLYFIQSTGQIFLTRHDGTPDEFDSLKQISEQAQTPLSDTDKLLVQQGGVWKEADKSELANNSIDNISDVDTINGNIGKLSYLACVVRKNDTTGLFELLDDSGHKPIGITGVITDPIVNKQFAISYNSNLKIGSILATPDETFSRWGLILGSSVGGGSAYFSVYKNSFVKRILVTGGHFAVADDTSDLVQASDITLTWDDTKNMLTISHPNIKMGVDDKVIVTKYIGGNFYNPVVYSSTPTECKVRFYDNAGNLKPLSSLMRFYYYRTGTWLVPTEKLNSSGNFWIHGIMTKK